MAIVAPLLETPGIMAIPSAMPIIMVVEMLIASFSSLAVFEAKRIVPKRISAMAIVDKL